MANLSCLYCTATFQVVDDLSRHLYYVHDVTYASVSETETEPESELASDSELETESRVSLLEVNEDSEFDEVWYSSGDESWNSKGASAPSSPASTVCSSAKYSPPPSPAGSVKSCDSTKPKPQPPPPPPKPCISQKHLEQKNGKKGQASNK